MRRLFFLTAVLLAFGLGLGIRLYDLTDAPFDFHPTRQLRAAVIARGMYYQALADAPESRRLIAVSQWQAEDLIEPPIMEWLASRLYLLAGSEQLWIPRALSAVFWLLGGACVFLLGRAISNTGGALIALAYFLFLPYGMMASRSFQPDPLMTAALAASLWMLHRWAHSSRWTHAALAGLFSAVAILAKLVAIFPIGMAALLLVAARGTRRSLRDGQTWAIAGIALLPVGLYYINGLYIAGFLSGQGGFRFFPQMWLDPAFYIRWVEMATSICGTTTLLAGMLGIFLAKSKISRSLLAGAWLGYIVYGFCFPYHFTTHDYYQLPLIPIAALSLAPAVGLLLEEIASRPYRRLAAAVLTMIAVGTALFQVWDARVLLVRQDFRPQAAEWARFDGLFPAGSRVLSISQTYGFPLAYYGWVLNTAWLNEADEALRALAGMTEEEIQERRFGQFEGQDFFLVTDLEELDKQPELQDFLSSQFEIFMEGEDYIAYDLRP